MARRFRQKGIERQVARRRIDRLFELAHGRALSGELPLADRAVTLARRIAMRYQTGLEPHQRDRVCRTCGRYLAPGSSARVRVEDGMRRSTCLACGTTKRRPYRREQRERRSARAESRKRVGPEPAPVAEPAPLPS